MFRSKALLSRKYDGDAGVDSEEDPEELLLYKDGLAEADVSDVRYAGKDVSNDI